MMIHPSYQEMISKINEGQDMDEAPLVTSRYSIVIAAAKRARQLIAGDDPMVINRDNEKALSTAIKELYEDQVHILPADAPEQADEVLSDEDAETYEPAGESADAEESEQAAGEESEETDTGADEEPVDAEPESDEAKDAEAEAAETPDEALS